MEQIKKKQNQMKVEELAKMLAMSRLTLYKMCKHGRIPHFRLGTMIRFCPQTVAEWLEDRELRHNSPSVMFLYATSRNAPV